jgi:hypothetical protein
MGRRGLSEAAVLTCETQSSIPQKYQQKRSSLFKKIVRFKNKTCRNGTAVCHPNDVVGSDSYSVIQRNASPKAQPSERLRSLYGENLGGIRRSEIALGCPKLSDAWTLGLWWQRQSLLYIPAAPARSRRNKSVARLERSQRNKRLSVLPSMGFANYAICYTRRTPSI